MPRDWRCYWIAGLRMAPAILYSLDPIGLAIPYLIRHYMASKKKIALAHSLLHHVLTKVSTKKASRNSVQAGDIIEVDLVVMGTLDGIPVKMPITGKLTVGSDSQTTKPPNYQNLLAAALKQMTGTRRVHFLDTVTNDTTGDEKSIADVEALKLRLNQTIPRSGSITFIETPCQDQKAQKTSTTKS